MHALGVFLLAGALTVKPDQAVVHAGCDGSGEAVATLTRGTAVEIRFAMAGGRETCYKVAAVQDGKPVIGYLPAGMIDGIERFEKERGSAPAVMGSSGPPRGPAKSAPASLAGDHPLAKATALLQEKQPRAALELAEKSLRAYGRDYQSLVIAGVAAYQADEMRLALEYLREAQALRADRAVEQLIARVEKETEGDKSGEKLYGTRFLLRYEDGQLHPDIARSMVATLEEEFSRISAELGCRTDERIVTVVQSRAAYLASTDAAEWSGGQFDGKIRIPLTSTAAIAPETRRAFAHEIVHACLAQMGHYPAWLHEGMAQKLSGETLSPRERSALMGAMRHERMPRLENMTQSWSRMSARHASLAYSYSLAAVEFMTDRYRDYGLHNVLRNPDRLPQIAAELDKALRE